MSKFLVNTGFTCLRDKAVRQAFLMDLTIKELSGCKLDVSIGLTQQDKAAIIEILNGKGATRRYTDKIGAHTARISVALRRLGYRFKWSETETYTICDFKEDEYRLGLMKEYCEFIYRSIPEIREVFNGSTISIEIDD